MPELWLLCVDAHLFLTRLAGFKKRSCARFPAFGRRENVVWTNSAPEGRRPLTEVQALVQGRGWGAAPRATLRTPRVCEAFF